MLKLSNSFLPRCATVLMMHRFAMPDLGVRGHDPAVLAAHLEYLRAREYELLSVADLLDRFDRGTALRRNAVVFTVDDGYLDFAEVAAPVFARYDCPVTVFLVTDFVAGRLWNWFDRVSWALAHSSRRELKIRLAEARVELRWRDASQCEVAARQLVERLKLVPDVVREKCVDALPAALDVEIPAQAPTEYKAMDWDTVRRCERSGTTFGPHTVSHPILSQLDDARAEQEIIESWHAVRDATAAAVPVFCYPNGGPRDFSAREERLAARAGMRAAVSGMEGCVHLDKHRRGSIDLFSLPRFAYSEQKPRFIQIASGIEALKARVRTPARLR